MLTYNWRSQMCHTFRLIDNRRLYHRQEQKSFCQKCLISSLKKITNERTNLFYTLTQRTVDKCLLTCFLLSLFIRRPSATLIKCIDEKVNLFQSICEKQSFSYSGNENNNVNSIRRGILTSFPAFDCLITLICYKIYTSLEEADC